MAFEALVAAQDGVASPEPCDMTRRFWVRGVLTVPLLIQEMSAHLSGVNLHRYLSPLAATWIQFTLGTPIVIWVGWPLLARGAASVRHRAVAFSALGGPPWQVEFSLLQQAASIRTTHDDRRASNVLRIIREKLKREAQWQIAMTTTRSGTLIQRVSPSACGRSTKQLDGWQTAMAPLRSWRR